jgi:phosphohistidine phosphatase SixA/CHAD domain-containing protein
MAVAEALAAIFANCLDHLRANEAAARASRPEGVHQVRVAARRLRSALKLFAALLPQARRDALDRELAWLADTLASARELDVFQADVVRMAEAAAFDEAEVLAALESRVRERREAAHRRVVEALNSSRYSALRRRVRRWRGSGRSAGAGAPGANPPNERLGRLARRLLARLHARALKRGRRFPELDAEARHRVRIALKRLRYAVDFFRSLYDREAHGRYLRRLKRLQDGLGRANDWAASERLLGELVGGDDDGALARGAAIVLAGQRRSVSALEPRLRQGWRSFERARPFWSASGPEPEPKPHKPGSDSMKKLLLLRHAKSSRDDPALDDFDRPLARRGEKAAPRIGRYLRDTIGWPDLVMCSAAARTRRTWDLAAGKTGAGVPVRALRALYMAAPERLLASIRRAPDGVESLAVVGHNPGLQELAIRLCAGGRAAALRRLTEKFPTGALAEIHLDVTRWRDAAPGTGRLRRFVVPRALARP